MELQNPWLGLSSYDEPVGTNNNRLFCGRDKETLDIVRLIDNNLFVTLYGSSGIGKTSILKAGVMPILRQRMYVPMYVRLSQNAVPYCIQIISEIEKKSNKISCKHSIPIKEFDSGDRLFLWNYFGTTRFFNSKGKEIYPVIILDQIEEIFRDAEKTNAETLLKQIYPLISDELDIPNMEDWSSDTNYRFIISIREDFLFILEDSIDEHCLDQLKNNRYRLRPLTEEGARDVILLPGQKCIEETDREAILRRIIDLSTRRENGQVDTLLLSMVCSYTYESFKKIDMTSLSMWKSNPMDTYYHRAINFLSDEEVIFIQNEFVNENGSRRPVSIKRLMEKLRSDSYRQLIVGENRILKPCSNGQFELIHDQMARAIFEEQKAFSIRRVQEDIFEIICMMINSLNKNGRLNLFLENEEYRTHIFNSAKEMASKHYEAEEMSHEITKTLEAINNHFARKPKDERHLVVIDPLPFVEEKSEEVGQERGAIQIQDTYISREMGIISTVMSDDTIPIENRISKVLNKYEEIDEYANNKCIEETVYINILEGYADFLYKYKRYDKSIEIFQKLLSLFNKQKCGLEINKIDIIYKKIGKAYICQGNYSQAREYLFKGLEILEGHDEKHLEVASFYYNIGRVYELQMNYSNALNYYLKALEIRENILGVEDPETVLLYNYIGSAKAELAQYSEAFEYYLKGLNANIKSKGVNNIDTAESYNLIGSLYYIMCDYSKALDYYQKAQTIFERRGTGRSQSAQSLYNIGSVYSKQGNYDMALEFYQKTLTVYEKVLGSDSSDIARVYNSIGYVYNIKGEPSKALQYYQKALIVYDKVLGPKHPDIARIYNNMGLVYYSVMDYSKALEYFKQSLIIYKGALGEEHVDTARVYYNMGLVFYSIGNYPESLECYKKTQGIYERTLGTDNPEITQAYNSIGSVYYSQSDYGKALEYYQRSLCVYEKSLGTDHPDTALSYNNVALVYFSQGNHPKALEYYKKALIIMEKVLGVNHPDIATSYNNIGLVYSSLGDYYKALEYYKKALIIMEKVLDVNHPDIATSYNNVGLVYSNLKNYSNALEYYQKALSIYENALGIEHPNVARVYNNIGFVYSCQGDSPMALNFYQKALAVYEKVLGMTHLDTARVNNNIGFVYYNKGDSSMALKFYQKALAVYEEVLGAEHNETVSLYSNIGQVYFDQGDYAKALEYYQKAQNVYVKVRGTEDYGTQTLSKKIEEIKNKIID